MDNTIPQLLPVKAEDQLIPAYSFGKVLSAFMGSEWQRVHPHIRARFSNSRGHCLFIGEMHEVGRSKLGWLIAKLIQFTKVLPTHSAHQVPFEFHINPTQNSMGWKKCRVYHFKNETFRFHSIMTLNLNGELAEQFPYGLGMKLKLEAQGDILYFKDAGYFWRLGELQLPIPHWLTIGRFTLVHRNISPSHFAIEIKIEHPLWGTFVLAIRNIL